MQPYKQSTKFTCSIASLMTILNHYDKSIQLNRETELELWQETVVLPTRRSSLFAMAMVAKEYNVDFKVIVEDTSFLFPEYRFKKYRKFEVELAEDNEKRFLRLAKKNNIKIEERDISVEEIKTLVKEGKKVLVRLNIGVLRNTKANRSKAHYIAIDDYYDNIFVVMDPRIGIKKIKENKMKEAFETVKDKCKRDHRMIIFG